MTVSDWPRETSLCSCKTDPRWAGAKGRRWAVLPSRQMLCDSSQDLGFSWGGKNTRHRARALMSIPTWEVDGAYKEVIKVK